MNSEFLFWYFSLFDKKSVHDISNVNVLKTPNFLVKKPNNQNQEDWNESDQQNNQNQTIKTDRLSSIR